jgi:hypothetical protein
LDLNYYTYPDIGLIVSKSSSDQEMQDCGNNLPGHHSHFGDGGGDNLMDVDEDNDLDGKDAAALQDIFNAEVHSVTVFVLNVLYIFFSILFFQVQIGHLDCLMMMAQTQMPLGHRCKPRQNSAQHSCYYAPIVLR